MINLNRMRKDDKFVTATKSYTVDECWSANGIYQLTTKEEGSEKIFSYDIRGVGLDSNTPSMVDFIEVENEDDNKTVYFPRFDIDVLPVLTVNGEDRFIYSLLDLNEVEVKEPQTLKAEFKYTILAKLQKKHGRDIEVIKEEKIICESREDCEQKLLEIQGHLIGEDVDENLIRKNFNEALGDKKVN